MLADLTRKYESVKRDLKLADDMQRIKTMYQVFLENTMAFLASNRGTLNPKNRKMTELELDEEFLKQYRELAQEWEKTLAELAKVLAKDPRLLARYMSLSRRRVDTLRDQLTLLNLRQQELLVPVKQLSGEAPAEAAASQKPGESDPDKHPLSPQEQTAAAIRAVQATLAAGSGRDRLGDNHRSGRPRHLAATKNEGRPENGCPASAIRKDLLAGDGGRHGRGQSQSGQVRRRQTGRRPGNGTEIVRDRFVETGQ